MDSLNTKLPVEIKKKTRLKGLQVEFVVTGDSVEPQSTRWLWNLPFLKNYNYKKTTKCLQAVKNDLAFIANCSSADINSLNEEKTRISEITTNCRLNKIEIEV